jgi:prepilin-type N-terminal cleavage/methylation domain-containing protein
MDQRGFTLIETLFSMAIALMLGLAALTLQKDLSTTNSAMSASMAAQAQLRNALRQMAGQMRMATTANDGSYPVAVASSTDFTFFADIDGDGVRERVRYYVDAKTLKCAVTEPTGDPLAYASGTTVTTDIVTDVANGTSVFEYYDDSYNGTGTPLTTPVNIPAVRLVRATVTVDRDSFRLPGAITLSAVASLRNVKTNL